MFHSCIKNSQWDEHDPSLLAILWNSWRNTKISFTKIITRVRHYIETLYRTLFTQKRKEEQNVGRKVQWRTKYVTRALRWILNLTTSRFIYNWKILYNICCFYISIYKQQNLKTNKKLLYRLNVYIRIQIIFFTSAKD